MVRISILDLELGVLKIEKDQYIYKFYKYQTEIINEPFFLISNVIHHNLNIY